MRRTCLLLCLALLLVLPQTAKAADMRVTSSTQFLWFSDPLTDQDDELFAEYLKMSITKLNPENSISIQGYGRGTYSLSNEGEESDDILGRLYYFYLDYRDVVQNVDLIAGRHYVSLPAGSALIDGATVNIKNIGPVDLRLLGGRQVIFSGDRNEIAGDDHFIGAGISTDLIRLTHIEAAYARKTDDADVARETVGISVTTYLPKRIAVYGEVKYDVLSESTNELLAGIKFSPLDRLTVTGEYYQSYPTFDATSIYSVFAVSQYQESLIKAEYALTGDYKFFLSHAAEDFDDGEDANRYEAGIVARPVTDLVVNISYDRRNGYGGELSGIRFNGRYSVTEKSAVSAGVDWDDFRRDAFEDETVKKYWVGGTHRFNETISLMVRAEDNVNVKYDHQYQGVVAVNAEF